MQNKDFDVQKWEQHCKLFDKNREGLHIVPVFSIKDGKMSLSLPGVEERYVAPLQKLARTCIEGAVFYLCHEFDPCYARESDYEAERKKNMKEMRDNTEFLLNVFFVNGFDEFLKMVNRETSFCRIRYEINQVSFRDGVWYHTDGSHWNGHAWVKNGEEVFNIITLPIWSQILSAE